MSAPKLTSVTLTSLTGSDNATGSISCTFDKEMVQAPLEVAGNYNFTPSLTIDSVSAPTGGNVLAWYPTDDCSGTTVYNSGSGGTAISGTFPGGSNDPTWDCSGGTGSLNYTTNNWVDYGTDAAWDVASNAWSVSLWFNPTALVNFGGLFAKKASPITLGGASTNYVFMLIHDTSGRLGIYNATTGTWYYSNSGVVSVGSWHNCVWTYDGSNTVTFYVNGTQEGTATIGAITDNSAHHVWTGAWLGNTYSSNGRIDNVQFHTEELTSTQVTDIYNDGIDGNPLSNPTGSVLTVSGLDTSQGYILDVNSNIVDSSGSLSASPNSGSFIAAFSRGVSNDSIIFKPEGEGLNRERTIERKPGVISNLSALASRTQTITEQLTVKYFQRVYDDGTAGYCYYTKTTIDPTPSAGETTPNYTGTISDHSVVKILEIY